MFLLNTLCGSVSKVEHPPGTSTTVMCSEAIPDARFILYQAHLVTFLMLEEIDVIILKEDYSEGFSAHCPES